MSNLSDNMANRGSKLCMQICVNNDADETSRLSRKTLLDKKIGVGTIKWLSPVWERHFKEYELQYITNDYPYYTGLEKMDWSFWPSRQPQWDAIGIAPDNTLVLVEAKSHREEVDTKCGSSDQANKNLIYSSIKQLLGDDPRWINNYYQIANRLVFLDRIKKFYGDKRKVVVVFLYFVNDVSLTGTSYKPATEKEWRDLLKDKVLKDLKIPPHLKECVKTVFLDVWQEKEAP